jgi:hypothetical protein
MVSIQEQRRQRVYSALGWLLPVSGLIVLAMGAVVWAPWARLLAATAGMLYLFKMTILISRRESVSLDAGSALLYFTIWPGMAPAPLAERAKPQERAGHSFIVGLLTAYAGMAAILLIAYLSPLLSSDVVGWLGLAALILTIHFGLSLLLTACLRLLGRPVQPLFDRPHASRTLWEFWTKRWNLAFVEMDRLLFMAPMKRIFGLKGAVFAVFIISGLLHEMALSYPAGGGWGGPMLYFALHGGLVFVERRFRVRSWLWTAFWILVPLPLLMHTPFRETFIVPLFAWIHGVLIAPGLAGLFGWLIWIMGIAHLLILGASFQVPRRLNWHEELPRLSAFNRKLMWTYGAFLVFTIVAFGVLTLALRSNFLRGDPAALGLTIFISAFWGLRLLVDFLYYRREDWPQGPQFVAGHALLTSLIAFLASSYGMLAVWHLLFGVPTGS